MSAAPPPETAPETPPQTLPKTPWAPRGGRLSILQAAYVIARRDFVAILFSRSFFFFLLGPLFPLLVGGLAGGIGAQVQRETARPQLGIVMQPADARALIAAHARLEPQLGRAIPELAIIREARAGEQVDPRAELARGQGNLAAVITGTLDAPRLTGPADRIADWQGRVALLAGEARSGSPAAFPRVALSDVASSRADDTRGRIATAQLAQTMLFLLTMLLAGMVLSNLVEEKGNKIIEILAAAIPMDAVFLGKLFAMLAVSLVGIAVWGVAGAGIGAAFGRSLPEITAPAVGWPLFLALGVVYFAMGYLLLGSLFLAIGSMATTVREVQTLSMPVTMMQLMVFFLASYAMARPGSAVELAAAAFPFSSPFAMLARAAQSPALWPHGLALAWQALCVAVFVKLGALLFRKRVMHSGAAGGRAQKRGWFRRGANAQSAAR